MQSRSESLGGCLGVWEDHHPIIGSREAAPLLAAPGSAAAVSTGSSGAVATATTGGGVPLPMAAPDSSPLAAEGLRHHDVRIARRLIGSPDTATPPLPPELPWPLPVPEAEIGRSTEAAAPGGASRVPPGDRDKPSAPPPLLPAAGSVVTLWRLCLRSFSGKKSVRSRPTEPVPLTAGVSAGAVPA